MVEKGLAPSREKAQAMIMAGLVSTADGRPVLKPGQPLMIDAEIRVARPLPYASRGGLKLEEALERFGLDVSGLVALDVGASTGGFVDCLLQRGAARVYAVDVDTRQLDAKLAADARVVAVEKNARDLAPDDIPEAVDLITMDVSFISVLKVLPALRALPGPWPLVALVKPQFEAGRSEVGRRGVVRDPEVHARVLERVLAGAREIGFGLAGLIRCSTRGQHGNIEFFAHWLKGRPDVNVDRVPAWIKEAVSHD